MIVFLDSVEKAVLLLVWGRVLSVLLGAAEHDIDTAQWRVVLAIVTLGGFIFDSFFQKVSLYEYCGFSYRKERELASKRPPGLLGGAILVPMVLGSVVNNCNEGSEGGSNYKRYLLFLLSLSICCSMSSLIEIGFRRKLKGCNRVGLLCLSGFSVVVSAFACQGIDPWGEGTMFLAYLTFIASYRGLYYVTATYLGGSFTVGEAMSAVQAFCVLSTDFALLLLSQFLPKRGSEGALDSSFFVKLGLFQDRSALDIVLEVGILGTLLIGLCATCASRMFWTSRFQKRAFYGSTVAGYVALVATSSHLLDDEGTNFIVWVYNFVFREELHLLMVAFWGFFLFIGVAMVMWYGSFVRGGLVVKRKLFHALALVLFCPPLLMAFELLKLALGVAFGILLLLEIVRANDSTSYYMKIFDSYMHENTDERDSGSLILTHLYLMAGCAVPMWLVDQREGHSEAPVLQSSKLLCACSGLISVGIGDALGGVIGKLMGKHRWPRSKKTFEGSAAVGISVFIFSVVVSMVPQLCFPGMPVLGRGTVSIPGIALLSFTTMVLEASTGQIDNILLPLVFFSLMSTV
jgi:dolichol kinase